MMSSMTPFMISIIMGIMKTITRLTKRLTPVSSRLAASNFFSAAFSVLKARITIRPERNSRVTRLSRSTSFCMTRNLGMATRNMVMISVRITRHRRGDDPQHGPVQCPAP